MAWTCHRRCRWRADVELERDTHRRNATIAAKLLVGVVLKRGYHCSSKPDRNEQTNGGVDPPLGYGVRTPLRLAWALLNVEFSFPTREYRNSMTLVFGAQCPELGVGVAKQFLI